MTVFHLYSVTSKKAFTFGFKDAKKGIDVYVEKFHMSGIHGGSEIQRTIASTFRRFVDSIMGIISISLVTIARIP